MKTNAVDEIVAALLGGDLPEAQPADLALAVGQIARSVGLNPGAPRASQVRSAVSALNGSRRFEYTKRIGDDWHARRGCDPTIQKHHAQALIELGALGAAQTLLDEALALAKDSSDAQFSIERPEYNGLLGRIRKQQFVQSDDVNHLQAATDRYLEEYSAKKRFYHGINIVALRTEEERRGLDPRDGETTRELAARVRDLAVASYSANSQDHWSLATASEACLALHAAGPGSERCDQAELWLHRFLNHPNTNPFSVESYSRQLREIWRGNPLGGDSCADRLAGIIDRHVRRSERRWSVDPRKVQEIRDHPEVLERNFSGEGTFTVAVLRRMLALCPNVGCVVDSTGARLGSGFLMPGGALGFAEPLVFVTNAHVISDTFKTSIKPTNAKVTFEIESAAAGTPVVHAVKQVLFTSEPGNIGELWPTLEKLDVTIVSLATLPKDAAGLTPAAEVLVPSPNTKAFVVGHPAAGALQFSLHDSLLLDVCDYERLMHYRTPTEPGSSGSPVFNADWEVVALHHAGSPAAPRLHGKGEYEANEAITIRAIRRKLGVAS